VAGTSTTANTTICRPPLFVARVCSFIGGTLPSVSPSTVGLGLP